MHRCTTHQQRLSLHCCRNPEDSVSKTTLAPFATLIAKSEPFLFDNLFIFDTFELDNTDSFSTGQHSVASMRYSALDFLRCPIRRKTLPTCSLARGKLCHIHLELRSTFSRLVCLHLDRVFLPNNTIKVIAITQSAKPKQEKDNAVTDIAVWRDRRQNNEHPNEASKI